MLCPAQSGSLGSQQRLPWSDCSCKAGDVLRSAKLHRNLRTFQRAFGTSGAPPVTNSRPARLFAGERPSISKPTTENEMRKISCVLAIVAMLPSLLVGGVTRADDIRPAMERANAEFLAAFNTP